MKGMKRSTAILLAFMLLFGALAPATARAEERAVEESATRDVKAQEMETTETTETTEREPLEIADENTPAAQAAPVGTQKTFTVTKRPVGDSSAPEDPVGEYNTFHEAVGACEQEKPENLYIITMNRDYTIPKEEAPWGKSSVNMLLQSAGQNRYTLVRKAEEGKNINIISLIDNCTLTVKNVILDGNNEVPCISVLGTSRLTLVAGTTVQHFSDRPDIDGPAIYLSGNSTLNIEDGVEIKDNKSDRKSGGAIELNAGCTLNINGGTFENNNSTNYFGGVILSFGTVNIKGGTFKGNKATYGGAIASYGELYITGGTFMENRAAQGGAILAKKSSVQKAQFKDNMAIFGGAIMANKEMTISDSLFEKNQAATDGGAIYAKDSLDIKESRFLMNYAQRDGGAIADHRHQYAYEINDLNAYRNITIDEKTLFQGNTAGKGLFTPPKNHEAFTNLKFHPDSDVEHGKLTKKSLLNNYDINYQNDMRFITYDANRGKFDDGSRVKRDECALNEEITIMDAPTRRGYDFLYWKDAAGTQYNPGDSYTVKDNHTFIAQWKKEEKPPKPPIIEKIIVDPNGGTFSDGATGRKFFEVAVGKIFHLPAAPTREGYKFIAWKGTDAEYQPDYTYVVKPGGETFVAEWEGEDAPKPAPIPTPRLTVPVPRVSLPVIPTIPKAGAGKYAKSKTRGISPSFLVPDRSRLVCPWRSRFLIQKQMKNGDAFVRRRFALACFCFFRCFFRHRVRGVRFARVGLFFECPSEIRFGEEHAIDDNAGVGEEVADGSMSLGEGDHEIERPDDDLDGAHGTFAHERVFPAEFLILERYDAHADDHFAEGLSITVEGHEDKIGERRDEREDGVDGGELFLDGECEECRAGINKDSLDAPEDDAVNSIGDKSQPKAGKEDRGEFFIRAHSAPS